MDTKNTRYRGRVARLCATLGAATALVVAGCGLQSGGGAPAGNGERAEAGSLQPLKSLDGVRITVGSKNFTEQLILGQMSIAVLQALGAEPVDKTKMAGSDQVRKALLNGEIDTYWEYVGTAWEQHLRKDEDISDVDTMYRRVAEADKKNGVTWLEPSPLINSYSLAINKENAERLGISKMSELASLDTSELTFCVGSEFHGRTNDGYKPMLRHYGIQPSDVPTSQVENMQDGLVYGEVAEGSQCNFGSAFTTDGRIAANNLVTLEDDKNFWPPYNVAVNFRTEVLDKHPKVADAFEKVSRALTTEEMQELTAQKDVEGKGTRAVARDWLRKEGFIE